MSKTFNGPEVDHVETSWTVGLSSFNAGNPATTAMQAIWAAQPPPGNLILVAEVVGALYADHYWNVTQMDQARLAAELQAALGLNSADCAKAAKAAFSRWFGLLVRGNMADQGQAIPRSGNLTDSPDVVVNAQAPLTVQQLISQWNTYLYTPDPKLKNYAYGRAASVNIAVPITNPTLRMYYSDAGLNPPPTSWVQLYTFKDNKPTSPLLDTQNQSKLSPGTRAASSEAFAFQPPGAGHYCLITVAGTEFFTNDPLTNGGNWSSLQWITYNGAAGWHNVNVSTATRETVKFYNQDSTPEQFTFEAIGGRLPKGAQLALRAEGPGLTPFQSISAPASGSRHTVQASAVLPPNYAGELELTLRSADGGPLPAGSSVEVRAYWNLPPSHPHYLDVVELLGDTRSALLGRPVRVQVGSVVFIGA